MVLTGPVRVAWISLLVFTACLGLGASSRWMPPDPATSEEKARFASLDVQVAPPTLTGEDAVHAADLAQKIRADLISTLSQSGFRAGSTGGALTVRLRLQVEYTFPDNTRLGTELTVENAGALIYRDQLPLETIPTRILPARLALTLDAMVRRAPAVVALAQKTDNAPKVAAAPPLSSAVVAVMGLAPGAAGISEADALQLNDYLAARTTEILGWQTVPRARLQENIRETKKESYQDCYDESCQIELGRAVAADKLLVSKLLKTDAGCVLSLSVYDLKTEASERAASAKSGCTLAEWVKAIDESLGRMVAR